MVNYFCESCNYSTNILTHFRKHCETKKHRLACGQKVIDREVGNNSDKKHCNLLYICQFCDKEFKMKRYLSQHLNRCQKKKDNEKDSMIEYFKEEMTNLKNKIDEKDKQLIENNKTVNKILVEGTQTLQANNKRIYNMSMKNQNSYKFILEHFKDAPDAFFPDDIEDRLLEKMEEYMDMDNPVMAISKAFLDFIPKQPQEKRFIHGIDISRVKYVVKKNGKWNVDYYAKEVIPKFVKHFKKSCGKFVNTELKVIREPRIYDRIAFLESLDSKILSNKVARKVSFDLQLNKEKYLKKMIELQST